MSKAGEIPYTWELIESQIREAILCQATLLTQFGPWIDGEDKITQDYLGIASGRLDYHEMTDEEIASVDITRHQIYRICREAYVYAYQLDGAEKMDSSDATWWHDADALLQSWPQTDARGEPSPFDTLNDFPLRRMLETFFARWKIEHEGMSVSVRELSLLANMTVPAVRTALSKEGFKLEKVQAHDRRNAEEASFKLDVSDALLWLSRRRAFIPRREQGEQKPDPSAERVARDAILADVGLPLPTRIRTIMEDVGIQWDGRDVLHLGDGNLEPLVEADWFENLLSGRPFEPDLAKFRKLAIFLDVSKSVLAAELVRHLMLIAE